MRAKPKTMMWRGTSASGAHLLTDFCVKFQCILVVQALEQKLANASRAQNYDVDGHEREWTRRLQEVELHWEKRLRDG